jgi:hypothetical protein
MMNRRIQYMNMGNSCGEKYCKMTINSSYGFDALNEEMYTHTKIVDKNKALVSVRRQDSSGMRQIDDDNYIVSYNPRTYKCKTCLQCAFFTLDNAKFWFLNFLYNFIQKFVDIDKVMVIYCDTDCMTFAVSGDPHRGLDRGCEEVVKDKEFYNEYRYDLLPDPIKGKSDEKKLLGFATENIGNEMIALAPKNYRLLRVKADNKTGGWMKVKEIPNPLPQRMKEDDYVKSGDEFFVLDYRIGLKGVDKKRNSEIDADAFRRSIFNGEVIYGENCGFHVKKVNDQQQTGNYKLMKETVRKVAISGVHTKMVVMDNLRCAPFFYGKKINEYVN